VAVFLAPPVQPPYGGYHFQRYTITALLATIIQSFCHLAALACISAEVKRFHIEYEMEFFSYYKKNYKRSFICKNNVKSII